MFVEFYAVNVCKHCMFLRLDGVLPCQPSSLIRTWDRLGTRVACFVPGLDFPQLGEGGYGGGEWTGKLRIFLNQLLNTQGGGKISSETTRDLVVVYERPCDLGNGCVMKKKKKVV
jgi:hypothetical protein